MVTLKELLALTTVSVPSDFAVDADISIYCKLSTYAIENYITNER
jgi:hypothetical protein